MNSTSIIMNTESGTTVRESYRDHLGLLRGVPHVFRDDGTVNWRAMLKPEHLMFNKDRAVEIAKKYSIDPGLVSKTRIQDIGMENIEDSHVLILLPGIRYLARLRGFQSVNARIAAASTDHVAVETTITWAPNFETDFISQQYTDCADAHIYNTFEFARNHLAAIAANRAFVRAVRNYLGVNIVGREEIGPDHLRPANEDAPSAEKTATTSMSGLLEEAIASLPKDRVKNFEDFRDQFVKKYVLGAEGKGMTFESSPETWKSPADIKGSDIPKVLGILKKKK